MKIPALVLNSVILLLMADALYAQSERFPAGYYVTFQQDTVRGYILDHTFSGRNNSFSFKSDLEQLDVQQFTPEQVSYFTYGDKYRYRAMKIIREGREETRFLQQLVDGYAELYQDNRPGKPIYILTKDSGENIQLERNDTIIGQRVKTDRAYIGKMLYLFQDCRQFLKQPPRIEFTQDILARVVHSYNKCAHPDLESTDFTGFGKFTIETSCAAGVGVLQIESNEGILDLSESGIGIHAGLLVKLIFQGRISFRTGLFYHRFRSEGTREFSFGSDFFATEYQSFEIPLTLQYHFKSRKITPYVYGGVNLPVSQKIKKHFERTEFGAQTVNRDRIIELDIRLFMITAGGGIAMNLPGGTDLLLNLEYDYKDEDYALGQLLRPHRLTLSTGLRF